MDLNDFYNILDGKVPGGVLENLEKSEVSDRKLYLTRISMDGLKDMHEYSKDRRLYKYFEFEPSNSVDETKNYLQKLIDRIGVEKIGRKHMYWFLRQIDNRKIIGSIGLVEIDCNRGSASWGYAISPDYWGRGYILEAQLLVMKYFFEELQMNRLWGITDVDNEMVKSSVFGAGFQQEGILREYYKYSDGHRKDGLMYSLLSRDYWSGKNTKHIKSTPIANLDQIKKICASVFKVPESTIHEDTQMSDVPSWDSLNHIQFISAVEKEMGIKFKPSDIVKARKIKSILEIINGTNQIT